MLEPGGADRLMMTLHPDQCMVGRGFDGKGANDVTGIDLLQHLFVYCVCVLISRGKVVGYQGRGWAGVPPLLMPWSTLALS